MEESTPPVNNINEQQVVTNPESKNLSIKISSILVVIIIILGGVSYAYYVHQQNSITMGNVVVSTIDAIKNSKIKSVEFSTTEDVSLDFKELNVKNKTTQTKNAVALLDGVNLSVSLNGIIDGAEKDSFKSYGKVNVNVKFDAPDGSQIRNILGVDSLALELEYYMFPDSIYFKLNKIPSIVDTYVSARGINLASYLNRWFIVTETEIKIFKKGFIKGFINAAQKDNKNFSENPFVFNGLSDENYTKLKVALIKYYDLSGAINIVNRKRETTLDGQNVTAIYFLLNDEKYISTEKELMKDLQSILSDSYPNLGLNANISKFFDNMDNNVVFKNATMSGMKFFVGSDGYYHGSEGSVNIK
ncbi:MAG: hypothetical protein WCG28_01555, partial [bacterium]